MNGHPVAAPPPPAWYLDTSAVTKLIVPEAESAALAAWCDRIQRGGGRVMIGDLVHAELLRTIRRHDPDLVPFALGAALAGLVTYDDRLAGAAERLGIARTAPGRGR